jgi:hypothetical protein
LGGWGWKIELFYNDYMLDLDSSVERSHGPSDTERGGKKNGFAILMLFRRNKNVTCQNWSSLLTIHLRFVINVLVLLISKAHLTA